MTNPAIFTSEHVLAFYALLDNLGIDIWLDGGWAVDALLGEQTRPHEDLDIIIEKRHSPRLQQALAARGYAEIVRDDTSPHNFVLGDGVRQVDFHVIVLDEAGDGWYGEQGAVFPAASLAGRGLIAGRVVRCITPAWLVRFHSGYPLRDKDYHDVRALCNRFGLPLPAAYATQPPSADA